ncbi:MAG: agmatinase [Gammaproteobacteria bacterium]|nr:agmatinase [Gammaproteobacteria bacterium]
MLTYLPSTEGFLGLEPDQACAPEDARAVIVPFGLEGSVTYAGGTSAGPRAMLAASHQVELFDEELWAESFREYGIATLACAEPGADISRALDRLEQMVAEILQQNRFPMIFGGEHSITAGAIRPFANQYSDLVVLHFDAHADLRDGYEGEHYSHAAAMRRVLDFEHIELISLGIRNISAEEVPFLESNRHRIHMHWARDKRHWDIEKILLPLQGRPVYLTFDLDGFDSSVMPATGTPEPGGLFWDDVLPVIRQAASQGRIVGADINELAPRKELHGCDFLAAKLAYKILNYALTL